MRAAFDLAHKNDVVTFFVAAAVEALEGRRGTCKQRRTTGTQYKLNACKPVTISRGKLPGQVLLVGTENVDGGMRACAARRHGAS